MKYTKFYYVKTIAELRSFSRAAEKLYISQPALTKSIGKLETELGVKLFDRSAHPLKLTYAGERYIAGMQSVIAMQNQLERELEEIANMKKGRLTVGIPGTRISRWLPYILPEFLRDSPGIDINVIEGTTTILERDLLQDKVDIVIATSLPQMAPNIDYEEMYKEQMMVLVSSKMPFLRDMNITAALQNRSALHYISPERLDGQPYISSSPDQGLYRIANQLFERFSIKPQKVITVENTSAVRDLAAQGLGFAVLPVASSTAPELSNQELLFCSITDPPTSRVMIVSYKHGKELSSAAKRFLNIAKTAAITEPGLQSISFELYHDLGD